MYNRIHNDYDNNVVRVELNSSYRPRASRESSREPTSRIASSINRQETFTKHERPSSVIRSETFILKHNNDDSSDERYKTYSRSKKKYHDEKKFDDKSHHATYAMSEKKGKRFQEFK